MGINKDPTMNSVLECVDERSSLEDVVINEVYLLRMSHESSRAVADDELPRSRRQLVMCGDLRTVRAPFTRFHMRLRCQPQHVRLEKSGVSCHVTLISDAKKYHVSQRSKSTMD